MGAVERLLLLAILERLENMATQADIDALRDQLAAYWTTLDAALTGIQADIDLLKAANPQLDLTDLQAKVSDLGAKVQQASDIDAETP